jgi:hypothetical protein
MPARIEFRSLIKASLVLIGIGALVVYVSYQARFLITGPQISMTTELDVRQNTRQIELQGTATNISHLQLNGRPIFTNPKGEFTTAVILENGYTVTTLTAEDRYGRITTVTRTFVYSPSSFIN